MVAEQAALGFHVVFEGIRMVNHTDGAEFCARYVREGGTYHVVLLTTTLEECLDGIRARQVAATGTTREVVVRDIESTITRNRNYAAKLREVGARMHHASRAEAPGVVLGLLRGEIK